MKCFAITAVFVLAAACSPRESAVDQATAETALAAMSLEESGAGMVTYADREFSDGVYTFTDVTLAPPRSEDADAGADESPLHAGRMVLANPQVGEDGTVSFERFALEAIRAPESEIPGERLSINSVVIERPNAALAADLARAFAQEPNEDPDWRSYAFGLMAMEGLSAVTPPTDSQPGGMEVAIRRIALTDLDRMSLGRFEIAGIRISGEDAETGTIRFALDELSMDGLGAAMFHAFQSGMDNAMATTESPAQPVSIPADFDPFDIYDRVTVAGLDVNIGGVLVTMDRAHATIDERRGGDLHIISAISPLVIAADPEQSLGAAFAMGLNLMGYEQLEFTSGSDAVYDRAGDRLYSSGRDYLEMKDGLRIEMEYDLGGYLAYTRAAMAMQTQSIEAQIAGDEDAINAMMAEMLGPLVLNRFVMRIEDRSLLERGLNAAAMAQGQTAADLRAQAGLMIAFGLAGLPAEFPRPLVGELAEALTAFINEGGTLVITMEPPVPVAMSTVMAQAEADGVDLAALGLSIRTETPTP